MVDADVLIAGERGVFDLSCWLSTRADEQFEIAAITVAEMFHGVERASGPHRLRRQTYVEAILSAFRVIPYAVATAQIHARLWAELELSGQIIGSHVLLVAATAVERGSAVATFNTRHFGAVPGLTVITPA